MSLKAGKWSITCAGSPAQVFWCEMVAEKDAAVRRHPAPPSAGADAATVRAYVVSLKDLGNDCFAGGDDDEAVKIYSKALDACHASMADLVGTMLCNRAACHLKRARWKECIDDCSEARRVKRFGRAERSGTGAS